MIMQINIMWLVVFTVPYLNPLNTKSNHLKSKLNVLQKCLTVYWSLVIKLCLYLFHFFSFNSS